MKVRAFVLVGLMAVFAGLITSFYGYYFWPTTGDGFLLYTIASVFLGGTSVFGGTGSVVGTFVAAFIIGAINAGIVSAGINAFYTQLAFGLVIVVSVVLQTIIERRIRRQPIIAGSQLASSKRRGGKHISLKAAAFLFPPPAGRRPAL